MTHTLTISVAVAAAVLVAVAPPARADKPDKLMIAIFAPSLEFTSGARLSYLNDVAQAIEAKTGIPTTARTFVKYSDMTGAKPDLAIIEAQCIVARSPGKVLATATIDGGRSIDWGLYSRTKGQALDDLRGKKVAYVKTGCRDDDFLDFALLLGVFRSDRYFGSTVAAVDANGAVVATRDVGSADAAVVPTRLAGGLSLIVKIDSVPNPGLVVMNDKLDGALLASVKAAVAATSGGPIAGWDDAASYDALAGRMSTRKKAMVLAAPAVVEVSEPDAISVPRATIRIAPPIRMLWKPPATRSRR